MKWFGGILVAVMALSAVPLYAADIRVAENFTLNENEIVDDNLYVAGGNVVVTGDIRGDLVAAGGRILVTGDTSEDVLVAGGTIDLLGEVGDDVRVAGGEITIGESVNGDLVVAGGTVHVLSGSVIRGDVIIAGGQVLFDGTANRDVRIAGGAVDLNGFVAGDVKADTDQYLRLGNEAVVGGNLTYTAPEAFELPEGARVNGEIEYSASEFRDVEAAAAGIFAGIFGLMMIGKFLAGLLVALLIVFFARKLAVKVSENTLENFGMSALTGFITLIVVPVVVVILFMSLIGMFAGFLLLTAYALLIMLAHAFLGIVVGGVLSQLIKKAMIIDWKWTVLGVITVQIISAIPFVGWIAMFVIFLGVFGAIVRGMHTASKQWMS